MMEWWNDIRMLSARYLVASEQMERSGPVEAAVRAAGYASEDEEDEEDGSSVGDEDEEGDEADEVYESFGEGEDHTDAAPPSYSRPGKDSGIEMGPDGYKEKKGHNGGAVDLGRRPSKRQQEKAPEGRPPHPSNVYGGEELEDTGLGHAPTESSRFVEVL